MNKSTHTIEEKPLERIIEAGRAPLKQGWVDFVQYKDLLRSFVRRDWKVRYGQTRLGWLWIFIQPILSAAILSLLFSRIGSRDGIEIPFPLYVLSGWICWSFFSSASTQSSQLLQQYQAIIRKVFFPKLFLPISKLLALLPEFLVGLLLVLIYTLWSGYGSWYLLWLLLALPFVLLSSFSVALLSFAIGGSYRDIQQLLPYFFQMLFFLTPVAYSWGLFGSALPPEWQFVVYLNPIAGAIELFRHALFGALFPIQYALLSFGSTMLLLLVGLALFRKEEARWMDEL